MSEVYFGRSDLFGVFDRLQRQFSSLLGGFPTGIRAGQLGAFPSVLGDVEEAFHGDSGFDEPRSIIVRHLAEHRHRP